MDIASFEALEAKIARVVDRLEILKTENEELRELNSRLQDEVVEKSSEIESLRQSVAEAQANARDLDKEEQIRSKVSEMLDKLESL